MAVSILSLYLKRGAPSTTEPFPCKRQKAAQLIFQSELLRNTIAQISCRLLIMFELNPTCRCKHLNKLRSTSYISAANAQLGTCGLDICIAEFWFGATMFESLGGPAIVWNLFCCILVFETFFRELSARTLASKLLNWYMFIRVRVGSLSFRINFCIQFHTLCFKAISLFIRSF